MSCDIIIPIWNQLKLTRECIESIIKYTDHPYRLILVDNNSDAGTKEYLRGLKASDPNVLLIENKDNLGYIKAVNIGISSSESEFIVVLNNDTLVTDGWLGELVEILKSNTSIALLNPASNNLGVKPGPDESINDLAIRLKESKGEWIELNSAVGFCMVFKRNLTKLIGLFDEVYGMGNFEDTDYSRRVQSYGFKCAMAKGSYVWHKQNTSFNLIKSFNSSFNKNKKIFESRWGKIERILFIYSSPNSAVQKEMQNLAEDYLSKGHWVTIFKSKSIILSTFKDHSGLKIKNFSPGGIFVRSALTVLFKKKKFTSIYVDSVPKFKLLSILKPIHKGNVERLT